MFNKFYDYLMNKQNIKYNIYCYSCKQDIYTCNNSPYLFQIIGIGKLHNRYICLPCLKDKLCYEE